MLVYIILLILGFVVLIKGASFLVDGAVMLAEKYRISPVIIGLTIVAFGTSTPELAVNIVSALNPASSDIGLGNIIGSNIANIGLIVGFSALIFPLAVRRSLIAREIPFMFLSALVFLVLIADQFLGNGPANILSQSDGIVLLLFFAIFIYYLTSAMLTREDKALDQEFAKEFHPRKISLLRSMTFIVIGLVGVVIGGKLVVDSASELAQLLGMSDILIGLTIVAIGTSLPELATSAVAAFKKETDIAVGNIVGSNIFNTFFILGVNAAISPVPFKNSWLADTWVMIAFSLLLFIVSLTGKKIKRWEGGALLAAFVIYMGFIITRG